MFSLMQMKNWVYKISVIGKDIYYIHKCSMCLLKIQDFARESELMADLKHPNIVCLIGVCMQEEPKVRRVL